MRSRIPSGTAMLGGAGVEEPPSFLPVDPARLDEVAHHLLDEERVTVGTPVEGLSDDGSLRRPQPVLGHAPR